MSLHEVQYKIHCCCCCRWPIQLGFNWAKWWQKSLDGYEMQVPVHQLESRVCQKSSSMAPAANNSCGIPMSGFLFTNEKHISTISRNSLRFCRFALPFCNFNNPWIFRGLQSSLGACSPHEIRGSRLWCSKLLRTHAHTHRSHIWVVQVGALCCHILRHVFFVKTAEQ